MTTNVKETYNQARKKLRRNFYLINNRETQETISYLIHEIEQYGFEFYPELYVADKVKRLNQLIESNTRGGSQ